MHSRKDQLLFVVGEQGQNKIHFATVGGAIKKPQQMKRENTKLTGQGNKFP